MKVRKQDTFQAVEWSTSSAVDYLLRSIGIIVESYTVDKCEPTQAGSPERHSVRAWSEKDPGSCVLNLEPHWFIIMDERGKLSTCSPSAFAGVFESVEETQQTKED